MITRRDLPPIFSLVFLSYVVHLTWFGTGYELTWGDWSFWDVTTVSALWYEWGAWYQYFNLGQPNIQIPFILFNAFWSLLAGWGLTYTEVVSVTFFLPIVVASVVSPYIYVRLYGNSRMAAWVGALFFSASTYFLVRQSAHLTIAVLFALAPILVALARIAFERNTLFWWTLLALLYTVAICYELRIAFLITICIGVEWLICLFRSNIQVMQSIKDRLAFLIYFVLIVILLNLFWILPVAMGGISAEVSSVANRGLFGNKLFTVRHALTLYEQSWTGSEPNRDFELQEVPWYEFLVPIVIILLIINGRKSTPVLIWSTVYLAAVLFLKQAVPPLDWFYHWVYSHVPGFSLFREASKYMVVAWLAFLGIYASSIGNGFLSEKRGVVIRGAIFGVLTYLSFLHFYPLLNQSVRTMFVPRFMIADYVTVNEYIKSSPEGMRSLWVPNASRWGLFSTEHPRVGATSFLNTNKKVMGVETYKTPLEMVTKELQRPIIQENLALAGVGMVVVPASNGLNADDIFYSYGGKTDVGIRDKYVRSVDRAYQNQFVVASSSVVAYKIPAFSDKVTTFQTLYSLKNPEQLNGAIDAVKVLNPDQYFRFTFIDATSSVDSQPLTKIVSYTRGLVVDPYTTELLPSDVMPENSTFVWLTRHVPLRLSYSNTYVMVQGGGTLRLLESGTVIASEPLVKEAFKNPYPQAVFASDEGNFYVNHLLDLQINSGSLQRTSFYLNKLSENHISDGSFENGTWQDTVGNCGKYDADPAISFEREFHDATDGSISLRLNATRHIACISNRSNLKSGEYILSFDYKGTPGMDMGWYVKYGPLASQKYTQRVTAEDSEWQHVSTPFFVGEDETSVQVFLYAYEFDRISNNAVLFDNVRVERRVDGRDEIKHLMTFGNFVKNTPPNYLVIRTLYPVGTNLVDNGDFEAGLWRKKVSDCANYDKNRDIDMVHGVEGENNYLELSARRHTACTSKTTAVDEGIYEIRMLHRSPTLSKGYIHISFSGEKVSGMSYEIPDSSTDWQTYTKQIKTPPGTEKVTLVLYARETDRTLRNVLHYDDISITRIPPTDGTIFAIQEKEFQHDSSKTKVDIINTSPTKYLINVSGLKGSTFVSLNDAYNSSWKVFVGPKVGIFDVLRGDFSMYIPENMHYKLNGIMNAWFFDYDDWCVQRKVCTMNSDGSYSVVLIITYTAQYWYYVGLIISCFFLIASLVYILYQNARVILSYYL